MRYLAMFVIVLLLTGCATPIPPNQSHVTFNSEPPGAMIYDTNRGTAFGMAPTERILYYSPENLKLGFAILRVTAIWPSGAQQSVNVRFNTANRTSWYTVSRPANAPGMNVDLAHAMQIQARDAAERARADAAYADLLGAFAKGLSDGVKARNQTAEPAPLIRPSYTPPAEIVCTTMGNTTTCRQR